MTDSASLTSDLRSSSPSSPSPSRRSAASSTSVRPTPATAPATTTTTLPRRPQSQPAMATSGLGGQGDVVAKPAPIPPSLDPQYHHHNHHQPDETNHTTAPFAASRLQRKRAASIDVQEANHPRIQSLSLYTPTTARSDGGRDMICLCTKAPKVPRPRNAFILYRQHWQGHVAAQHPGLANPDISKLIGEKWREQPDEVKNSWKQLAEEEKIRHQRQYPDYRYQPRRGGKNASGRPTSAHGGDSSGRCPKCGGRYIATPRTPSTPFSVATTPAASSKAPPSNMHQQPYINPNPRVIETDHLRRGSTASAMSIDGHGRRYTQPMLRDIDEDYGMMSPTAAPAPPPDHKRRRYNGPQVFVPGSPPIGYIQVPDPRYQQQQQYPQHPQQQQQHRPSVSGPPPMSASGYGPGPLPQPPPMQYRQPTHPNPQNHPHMQPPPRPSVSYHQQMPMPMPVPTPAPNRGNAGFDESLRLPPLQTQVPNSPSMNPEAAPPRPMSAAPQPAHFGTGLGIVNNGAGPVVRQQQPQQVVQQVQAQAPAVPPRWPFLLKLDVLRSISPPLKPPGPGGPFFERRGPIIAIEGASVSVMREVAAVVEKALSVSGEYAVKMWSEDNNNNAIAHPSPAAHSSAEGADGSHANEDETEKSAAVETSSVQRKPSLMSPIANYVARMLKWHKTSEELIRYITSAPPSTHTPRAALPSSSDSKTPEDSTSSSAKPAAATPAGPSSSKLPVAILADGYSLTFSNRYAGSLHVNDAYRADDHWQWVATLWRGIVGADLTVYVKRAAEAELQGNNCVEFVGGSGVLVLRVVEGRGVDEKLERRLGFEISEWVRSGSFKAGFESLRTRKPSPNAQMSDLAVGQTIRLSDGRIAVVRFAGQTHFAPGDWLGVELEDDSGKNDGAVQGERYFDCSPGKGMFVRPSTATIIQAAPALKAAAPIRRGSRTSTAAASAGRPSSRPSSVNDPSMGKRMSMNAPSPSPVPRTSRPSISHQIPDETTGDSPSKYHELSNWHPIKYPHLRCRSQAQTFPWWFEDIYGSASTSLCWSTTSTLYLILIFYDGTTYKHCYEALGCSALHCACPRTRTSYFRENNVCSPIKSDGEQASSPVLSRTKALEKLTSGGPSLSTPPTKQQTGTPTSRTPGGASSTRPAAANAISRENEDLKSKIKVLERKRLEDREKLKEIERLQEQRDKFETINKKIETKFQATSQENAGLRKQLKEAEDSLEQIESLQAEHESIMELATLDREMAEETAEVLKSEFEALKQKAEELELEVEILREENSEYSNGMSPEDRASTGWLQMERNNERLRDALIRLRDITQQQDEENKLQIKSLEADLEEFDAIKEQYEIAKEKLLESEVRAEDLRQQLDDNLGAEAIIEQLSYEKLTQSEQINELKAMIDDLEALKEINDELEINHVQNEKEMQEDLDFKDTVIAEQVRRASEKDDAIGDLEYTLSRFRELVTNLQTDIEDLRASHVVNEAESEKLGSTSRLMMDLNHKLQISTEKTQVKTIELELQRMDAKEAQQHLQIVKLFLPESFAADRDSVLALLRFGRLAFKANLLHGFIKERVGGQPHPGHEDEVFAGCDALDKLTWVSSMCDRFVNAISHCSLEQFAKYEGALYELEPVERALNNWIEGLRKDELKEMQCASELQRTIALMTHLGEVHISEGLESFADEVQMKAVLTQSHLESGAAAFNVIKGMVQRVVPVNGEEDELAQHFAKRADAVISQTRSAKVIASKAVRSLDDLRARSLALTPDTAEAFEQCENTSQELVEMSRKIGNDLHTLLTVEGRSEAYSYPEVQTTVSRTVMSSFASAESDLFSTYLSKLRVLTGQITDLAAVCSDLSQTQEFERNQAPWILRAQELKALKTIPVDAEEELRQLKDHYNQARRDVALRDENLSTATLRIETLEARMRDANAKASRMADLESQIVDVQSHIATLQKDLEQQDREAKALEADRDKWKKIAGDSRAFGDAADAAGAKAGQDRAVATAREMDALNHEIKSLEEAVNFLRADNHRARITEQPNYDWLSEPLIKPVPVQEQRKALVAAEARDCSRELLKIATDTEWPSFPTPEERGHWRPYSSTMKHYAEKKREEFEKWEAWDKSVKEKARLVNGPANGNRRAQRPAANPDHARIRSAAVARLQIRMPSGVGGKVIPGSGRDVQVQDSRTWEELSGMVSTA
ncbi:Uu.00g064620.m01.CDS01 [Anthostomella pinea]|uniref:Uu.00g064620.m01.CDS01 n=1 Tax=Anthostomella pinea TaxID=933095 RepID=A0AAI8VTK1_9PEZI|nr:Uu.00g064620.m01.CDS01 [Anthostomella pinea]